MKAAEKILIILLACPFLVKGQIITTICGTGSNSTSVEAVPASASPIRSSGGGVFDNNGNYYFCQGIGDSRISRINASGILNTVAGTGTPGYAGDGGAATLALLKYPNYPAVDSAGNIYIPDGNNNRIRKVTVATGIITTVAGTGVAGYNGDGIQATATMINGPASIAFDKRGDLYFSDYNNLRIRKIDSAGIISTVVGSGALGFSGDGGMATAAKINGAIDIKFDDVGNLYIADQNNGRIRKVNTVGIITTVAGNGTYTYNGDNIPATNAQFGPYCVSLDRFENIFIGDVVNHMIRYVDKNGFIHTIAGTTVGGYNGDGTTAIAAQLNHPNGIALDSCGNIYITDSRNYRIRKITYPHCHYLETEKITLASFNISTYPNPANDELHIENAQPHTTYQLYNIVGAVQQGGLIEKSSSIINIKHQPPGIYLLALTDGEGRRMVYKIVKE